MTEGRFRTTLPQVVDDFLEYWVATDLVAEVAEKVLGALVAGDDEVLVDELTEQVKAALAGPVDRLALAIGG